MKGRIELIIADLLCLYEKCGESPLSYDEVNEIMDSENGNIFRLLKNRYPNEMAYLGGIDELLLEEINKDFLEKSGGYLDESDFLRWHGIKNPLFAIIMVLINEE